MWILRCVTFIFVARTDSGHMGAPTRVYFTGEAEERSSENLSSERAKSSNAFGFQDIELDLSFEEARY